MNVTRVCHIQSQKGRNYDCFSFSRDIVSNARSSETLFQRQLAAVDGFMRQQGLSAARRRRILDRMRFTWQQQKSINEWHILEPLPPKVRCDIAMRVHYETLVKVKLFRNCEPGMLKDLSVLLAPMFYLPGDMICMKNDIGKVSERQKSL